MKKDICNNEKGTAMIEATVIFPVVIMTLIATIYIILNMYRYVCMQSVVDLSSERGAYYVAGTLKEKDLDGNEAALYYLFHNNQDQMKKVSRYGNYYMNAFSLGSKIDAEIKNTMMSSRINVKSENLFQIPGRKIQRVIFATYYIHDEAEYIRNVDLLTDVTYSSINNIFDSAKERSDAMQIK